MTSHKSVIAGTLPTSLPGPLALRVRECCDVSELSQGISDSKHSQTLLKDTYKSIHEQLVLFHKLKEWSLHGEDMCSRKRRPAVWILSSRCSGDWSCARIFVVVEGRLPKIYLLELHQLAWNMTEYSESSGQNQTSARETTPSDKISGKAWGRVKKFFLGKSGFPRSIYFIVGNEFCERFSFYGMKAILILYLTRVLKLGDNTSTALFHTFSMFCYFTPLIGAMIADSWLGKYRLVLKKKYIFHPNL